MKGLRVVFIIVVGLALMVLLAIYTLPEKAHMERHIEISATPSEIYTELLSYRNFNEWSPWAQKDSDAKYIYEGPLIGVGARMMWKSNNPDLGNGSMEIIKTKEERSVVSLMQFDGYESMPTVTFILEPIEKDATKVIWTYDEKNVTGFSKIFMLGIDGFLGGDFELGLERLKVRVESAPEFNCKIKLARFDGSRFIGLEDSSINEPAIVTTKMAMNYGELQSFLATQGIESTGYPITMFTEWNNSDIRFICGIPIAQELELNLVDDMALFTLEPKACIKTSYFGGFGMNQAQNEINRFARYHNFVLNGNPWEEYVPNALSSTDSSATETNFYFPIN